MMSSSQNECPLYYSLSSLGSRTDRQYIHTLWTMKLSAAVRGVYEFFLPELVWKLKNNICSSFISRNKYSLRTLTSHDCIHSSGMCTYIVTAMANKPPHNFKRHRLRPSRIPYHSVAIRFNAVMTKAAPENPVIITVILHKISHPIGVPGKSFVCGKNW